MGAVNRNSRYLIVNKTNFSQSWAAEFLHTVFRPDMHAVIIPLGHDEGWAAEAGDWDSDFAETGERHEDVERPLRSYGVQSFAWLDFHREDEQSASRRILGADICVLVGSDASGAMDRIEDLNLTGTLKQFGGILITLSEVSQILTGVFEEGEERDRTERPGLNLLPMLKFHMHYSETEEELRRMIRYLESDSRALVVLSEKSGLYVENGKMELLGDAFIAEDSDLDELYSLL